MPNALPVRAVARWNSVCQKIDGFGFSEAFNKTASIYRQQEPLRTQLLDLLFDTRAGIGASILRNIVGDGGYNTSGWGNEYDGSADTIWPDREGGFVWNRPGWETVKNGFDFYQIWLTREAMKRGLKTIIATCWSPPAWMKSNGTVIGDPGAHLLPEFYHDFAVYLAEYVLGYEREFGITISYISPANEPVNVVAYPGCFWTPDTITTFVKDHLGPVFAARGVDAKILLPEYEEWGENSMITSLLHDEDAARHIFGIASHAYRLGIDIDPMALVKEKGKALWMTETGDLSGAGFNLNTIVNGLANGRIIQEMMTGSNISAWLYWWGAANNKADGSDLIRLGNTGTDQSIQPTENGTFRIFKRFYALGNFSRFIRPGFLRIDIDKTPVQNLTLTAYKDPQGGAFAVIALNETEQNIALDLELKDFPGMDEVASYVTSATDNLRPRGRFPVARGIARVALPAKSIVTLIAPEPRPPEFALKLRDVFSVHPAIEADEIYKGAIIDGSVRLPAGGYVLLKNFNFADGSASDLPGEVRKLAMIVKAYADTGGALEVRLDSPDGCLVGYTGLPAGDELGEFTIPISTCTEEEMLAGGSDSRAYGIRNLYLVMLGGENTGGRIMSVRFGVGNA